MNYTFRTKKMLLLGDYPREFFNKYDLIDFFKTRTIIFFDTKTSDKTLQRFLSKKNRKDKKKGC